MSKSAPDEQPLACIVLCSEDGNAYDAAQCTTCRTVLGPYPQPPHELAGCVRALAERINNV